MTLKKKTAIGALAIVMILLAVLLWRLDILHWTRLDMTRLTDMPAATLVFDADNRPVGTLDGSVSRQWTPLSDIPAHVQNAFIAAEDLRFYRHHGVDVHRMLGALWRDLTTLSYAQGASTITQQVIKLTHLSSTKTLSRKVQEIFLALQLERRMPKSAILEAYLNVVYFGHGAYGIESAAQTYFGKPASGLSLAEGALLAGVIKAPSTYAPHLNAEKSLARRDSILTTMAENGFISEEALRNARAEALSLATEQAPEAQYAWYMETVLDEARAILTVSADEVLSGGLRIYTGLNPAMQAAAEQLFDEADSFPMASDGTPAQAALIALDTGSGEMRAILGGRTHDVRRGLNRATQMKRQPGSAFKPVSVYAAAVDAYGYLPASMIDDTPRTFPGGYAPRNAGGSSYGTVTLREALSRSLNIATVDLASRIGVPALRSYAERFGLSLSPMDMNLSLALGSLTDGVSPASLCAAYCALANGGERVEAHAIRRICDSDGQVLYQAPRDTVRSVRSETAYLITDMLKTAATSGSARALSACGLPVAGKTGTVSEGSSGTRDIWTAAYTPELAVTVWMGCDTPDPEHTLPSSEGGSGCPARMCAAFLKGVSGQLGRRDFSRPKDIRAALLDSVALEDEKRVLLSTEKTPREFTRQELFYADSMPETFSDNWIAPAPVRDFRLLTGSGEAPVLAFTAQGDGVEYLLLRKIDSDVRQLAVLSGESGEEVRYCDDEHDLSRLAEYTLLPRNARLFECGVLLTGPETPAVRYSPGGLLNRIMGVGMELSTPTPTEIEISQGIPSID